MTNKIKVVFNWSGGKDSALALYKILNDERYEVIALLTTIDEQYQKSSIHAIPIELIQKQAESIGIPLYTVTLSENKTTYEQGMTKAIHHFKELKVSHFAFGDIFLTDVKSYRESRLNPLGIEIIEPLWGGDSKTTMVEFLASGIKTKVIVTQAEKLDESYIGKEINIDFIKSLPSEVDVCGENGEYHTFAFDGSIFNYPVEFIVTAVNPISYSFKMDNGEMKTFDYWQAEMTF